MAASSAFTSFKRKSRGKFVQIPGTRPSLHDSRLLVSTGVPSVDAIIGGGIPVGSVLLLEEDEYGTYAQCLLNYYLAEGLMSQHEIFLASADSSPASILKKLPGPVTESLQSITETQDVDEEPPAEGAEKQDELQIAWRYKSLPPVKCSVTTSQYGHYYDLSKTMGAEFIEKSKRVLFDVREETYRLRLNQSETTQMHIRTIYQVLSKRLQDTLKPDASAAADKTRLTRIAVQSLGSPFWGTDPGELSEAYSGILGFLWHLRAVVRSCTSVAMVTVPTHLFQDVAFVRQLRHLSDMSLFAESFVGTGKESSPLYKNYHGLFHINKLPRINAMVCYQPHTLDLAFCLKRRKFIVETLHLPPDLSEMESTNKKLDALTISSMAAVRPVAGCGAGGATGNNLDF